MTISARFSNTNPLTAPPLIGGGSSANTLTVWKRLRIAVLLVILTVVAANAWLDSRRVANWRSTVDVGIFPIAGDDSPLTHAFVAGVDAASFQDIDRFFDEQSRSYGLPLAGPVHTIVYPVLAALPPAPPAAPSVLSSIVWSLRMRYYAAGRGHGADGRSPDVRIFVLFHNPAASPAVAHSVGLRKGQVGVVHAFASRIMAARNAVVIAHELLHTFGATDKYDPSTNAPLYPAGYAEPDKVPRYPQPWTEVMAGRRPLSPTEHVMPDSLDECVVGPATAAEIHWTGR